MTLADGVSIASKENYLVEPFVALAGLNASIQVIVGGRAFRALKGVKRVALNTVWRQGEALPATDEDEEEEAEAPEPSPGGGSSGG